MQRPPNKFGLTVKIPDLEVVVCWGHKKHQNTFHHIKKQLLKDIPALKVYLNATGKTMKIPLDKLSPYHTDFWSVMDAVHNKLPTFKHSYKEWLGFWSVANNLHVLDKIPIDALTDAMETDFEHMKPDPRDLIYMIHTYKDSAKMQDPRLIWWHSLLNAEQANYMKMNPKTLRTTLARFKPFKEFNYVTDSILKTYVKRFLLHTHNKVWVTLQKRKRLFLDWLVEEYAYDFILYYIEQGKFFPYFANEWKKY